MAPHADHRHHTCARTWSRQLQLGIAQRSRAATTAYPKPNGNSPKLASSGCVGRGVPAGGLWKTMPHKGIQTCRSPGPEQRTSTHGGHNALVAARVPLTPSLACPGNPCHRASPMGETGSRGRR
eukprot:1090261-Alexandrium_andersonii.AAC.1